MTADIHKVCFPYEGRELGGSHISSIGLIKNLDRARFQPLIVLSELEGAVYEMFKDHQMPVVKGPVAPLLPRGQRFSFGHVAKVLPAVWPIARFLKREKIKIVHSNDGRSHALWGAPAKIAGARLFWHHRSGPHVKGLRYVAPLIADQVVSVSQFSSPRPGFFSAARKNSVVYSPFDVTIDEDRNVARAAITRELDCDPATKYIGYFGTFNTMKRPSGFVDAIAALAKTSPDFSFVGLMFGPLDDPRIEPVRARAREMGVADKIRFMGFRFPGAHWLAGCDVLLVPAVGEPFGRTLVEAMLVGTPIIATQAGGNPEAVSHQRTGLLVRPEDADAMAAAAAGLLSDDAMAAKFSTNARKGALERFGEQKHAEAIMTLYENILCR